MRVRFADCTLDAGARRLINRGEEVHLPTKAFELLKLLVDNRPRALSKSELIERLWPGVFVADDSLAKVVSQLRKAIGDDGSDQVIVRTVHGFGYAFEAEVGALDGLDSLPSTAGRAACWLFCGSREFALGDGEYLVGREPDADICLDSPKISRHHARIVISGPHATIEDLGSKNGSFVRGVRVSGPTPLASGDEIRIGSLTLLFRVSADSGSTQTLT